MKNILNGRKLIIGTMAAMLIMGSSSFGIETSQKRKAREIEARIMANQAEKNGVKIISQQEAKEIAFRAAEVNEKDVRRLKIKLDREDDYHPPVYIYEVEFSYDGLEYEFDIDGENGRILKTDVEAWYD